MPSSFEIVRDLCAADAGIILDAGKEYLVDSRLGPIVRTEGLASIDALTEHIVKGRSDLRRKVIDAMTTNETTFFRDTDPFELLRTQIFPTLIQQRKAQRRLRIWYAASSTGQEPYSVSMLIAEHFPELASWDVDQIATDISRVALARAIEGRYSQLEVNRGLPVKLLMKYFEKRGMEYHLSEQIRRMVKFQELNLNGAWPAMSQFDIIFIRNVMIYFDVPAKKRILGRMFDLLRPDGYLFLGAAETTLNLDERFTRLPAGRTGCYQPQAVAVLAK